MNIVWFLFGKEEVNKFLAGEPLTKDNEEINIRKFMFSTPKEAEAFIQGVQAGVGWLECYNLSENEIKKLKH